MGPGEACPGQDLGASGQRRIIGQSYLYRFVSAQKEGGAEPTNLPGCLSHRSLVSHHEARDSLESFESLHPQCSLVGWPDQRRFGCWVPLWVDCAGWPGGPGLDRVARHTLIHDAAQTGGTVSFGAVAKKAAQRR